MMRSKWFRSLTRARARRSAVQVDFLPLSECCDSAAARRRRFIRSFVRSFVSHCRPTTEFERTNERNRTMTMAMATTTTKTKTTTTTTTHKRQGDDAQMARRRRTNGKATAQCRQPSRRETAREIRCRGVVTRTHARAHMVMQQRRRCCADCTRQRKG